MHVRTNRIPLHSLKPRRISTRRLRRIATALALRMASLNLYQVDGDVILAMLETQDAVRRTLIARAVQRAARRGWSHVDTSV